MRLLIPMFLLLALCPLTAAPAQAKDKKPPKVAEVKPPKRPANLEELGQRLAELAQRIELLLAEAAKDADERKIEEYRHYSSAILKKTRKRVRAKELVVFMVDGTKGDAVRRSAQDAIHKGGATRSDPDLALDGSRTKRASFCKKELVPHLRHPNRRSRDLVNELLKRFWSPNAVRNPEIMAYKVDKEATWGKAMGAWNRYLSKK